MVVFVNNQQKEIGSNPSIKILLEHINLDSTRGIALAVNDAVVPKTDWGQFLLKENDRITIIKATQGG